jgi:hypothetical protein
VNLVAGQVYGATGPTAILSVGSGGMEVERQVIKELISVNYDQPVVFVGMDHSLDANNLARANLLSAFGHKIKMVATDHLSEIQLREITAGNTGITVVICRNDIFMLGEHFSGFRFDLSFHTLFKHHLKARQKRALDDVLIGCSNRMIEYDGFKSWRPLVDVSVNAWDEPVFLNSVLFSILRYSTRKDLKALANRMGTVTYFPVSCTYLLEHR